MCFSTAVFWPRCEALWTEVHFKCGLVCGQWVHSRAASATWFLIQGKAEAASFFTTQRGHYGADIQGHCPAGVHPPGLGSSGFCRGRWVWSFFPFKMLPRLVFCGFMAELDVQLVLTSCSSTEGSAVKTHKIICKRAMQGSLKKSQGNNHRNIMAGSLMGYSAYFESESSTVSSKK